MVPYVYSASSINWRIECCQLIDKYVETPFNFTLNEALQDYLTNFQRYDDEWLFQRSNLIEPRVCYAPNSVPNAN